MLEEGIRRTIRILVVDAHPVVRSGLEGCFARHSGMSVLSSASSVRKGLSDLARLGPDVAILDSVPVSSAAREIWLRYPSCKIVAFPSVDSEKTVRDALRAGVQGYVPKTAPLEEVVRAIRTVHAGEVHYRARHAALDQPPPAGNGRSRSRFPKLTGRERQVLGLIAEGYNSRRIASLLRVSIRTVESHREHIVRKLGIRTVAGLTRFAIENDLVGSAEG